LDDEGIWINVGPLLWHFENSATVSKRGEGSVELSLDEVKELARVVGFDLSVSPIELRLSVKSKGLIGRMKG
jgi:hypothetical protein